MSPQAKPSYLPNLSINQEIWYPPCIDTSSKPPTTANPRHSNPRNKTLLPNHKHKSRFFPLLHGDGSKKPLTNPLGFNPPATPPLTPQSPSIYYPIRCSPILPSPSLLLPLSFFPSPVPSLPLSPIAPPSPYHRQHHQNPKKEGEEGEGEEAYEKLGSAALLKDNTFYLKENVAYLKDRVPYFGSGHAPNGRRDIDTLAVKRFFKRQWERRVWEVLLSGMK